MQQRLPGRGIAPLDHLAHLRLQERQVRLAERFALVWFLGRQLLAPRFEAAQAPAQLIDPRAAGRFGHRALLEGAEVAAERFAGLAQIALDPLQLSGALRLLCLKLGEGLGDRRADQRLALRQQLDRRHLAGGVERLQVARKAADRPQPPREVAGAAAPRQPGPLQRDLGRDRALPGGLGEGDEPGEQLSLPDELEPQRAAQRQVIVEVSIERLHAATPRPGPNDRGEREPVDLRVDRGDVPAAMPQHLADLGQPTTRPQHLGGSGVAQAVSAHHRQPGSPTGTVHEVGHGAGREAAVRGVETREQERRVAARATPGQPGGERLADVGGQRQALLTAALAADQKLTGTPVDVVKPQGGDLAGAKPEP